MTAQKATISVFPKVTLVDERVQIRLTGLPAHEIVTLQVEMDSVLGLPCEATCEAEFQANGQGEIDLDRQAPLFGPYATADAMGLFWSMHMQNVRWNLARNNREFTYGPYETTVRLRARVAGQVLCETECVRQFVGPDVVMESVTEPDVVGKFFYKKGAAQAPAVIVLGGGEGGLGAPMTFAGILASHGFPALALAYFRFEDLPSDLQEIPLEYFAGAIAWLQAQPSVREKQIAVLGRSKGAELALLLGAVYPEIGAVIASSPSSVACIGNMEPRDNGEYDTFSSWSYRGQPLPFAAWSDAMCDKTHKRLQAGERIDDIHHEAMLVAANQESIQIPVEKIQGPILLISSGDDHWWPAELHSQRLIDRLRQHAFSYEIKHLNYPDAGHVLRFPYIPTTQLRMNGGTPEANHLASLDSWQGILEFLSTAWT